MDSIQSAFKELLVKKTFSLDEETLQKFERYANLLIEWNYRMNLTSITERDEIYIKHFYDSIALAFFIPMHTIGNLADIGSGAGFPSLPIKLIFPHLKIVIVDSLKKRISFLEHVAQQLQLSDVQCIHGRAEDVARNPEFRDSFDLATARAVARQVVLNELCLPFVRSGGHFAAMKGADPSEELQESTKSLGILHAKLERNCEFDLPMDEARRHILLIKKTGTTPNKYPRKAGTPSKQPLV